MFCGSWTKHAGNTDLVASNDFCTGIVTTHEDICFTDIPYGRSVYDTGSCIFSSQFTIVTDVSNIGTEIKTSNLIVINLAVERGGKYKRFIEWGRKI